MGLVGWSVGPSHFRISNLWSVTVAHIKKNSKNKVHLFSNFASGRTSQLVPSPFNWSPKTVFYRNLSIGRSNKKKSKNLVHLFSNFDSGRTSQLVPNPFNWSPTHSTGPQKLFFTESSVLVAQIQK